jgi:hypothetical protein
MYVFMSFVNLHTRKNMGVIVVEAEGSGDFEIMKNANDKALALGVLNECNTARGYVVPDTQGLELNRLYTPEELKELGFQKESERHGTERTPGVQSKKRGVQTPRRPKADAGRSGSDDQHPSGLAG